MKPVEIDETHVYARKYHRGRGVRQRYNSGVTGPEDISEWVIVILERRNYKGKSNYRRVLNFLVENRKIPVIDEIIGNFVYRSCPLILTDSAPFYEKLGSRLRMPHRMVDHSKRYVEPEEASIKVGLAKRKTPVHTQNVERYNKELKRFIKKRYGHLAQYHEEVVHEAAFWVAYRNRKSNQMWERAVTLLMQKRFQELWDL